MGELTARHKQSLKLAELRNDEAIKNNSIKQRELTAATAAESHLMAEIAKQTRQDSQKMKIASVIAVLFLPASLVSVSSVYMVVQACSYIPLWA